MLFWCRAKYVAVKYSRVDLRTYVCMYLHTYILYSRKIFTDGSKNENSQDEIFVDAGLPCRTTTQLCLIRGDFIFTDVRPTAKSLKILSRENFPIYSRYVRTYVLTYRDTYVRIYHVCIALCTHVDGSAVFSLFTFSAFAVS